MSNLPDDYQPFDESFERFVHDHLYELMQNRLLRMSKQMADFVDPAAIAREFEWPVEHVSKFAYIQDAIVARLIATSSKREDRNYFDTFVQVELPLACSAELKKLISALIMKNVSLEQFEGTHLEVIASVMLSFKEMVRQQWRLRARARLLEGR